MTMLERVARAISQAFGERVSKWHEVAGYPVAHPSPDDDWESWLDCARASLTALREPTEGMIHDGALAIDHPSVPMGGPSYHKKRLAAQVWRAMIRAAEGEQ